MHVWIFETVKVRLVQIGWSKSNYFLGLGFWITFFVTSLFLFLSLSIAILSPPSIHGKRALKLLFCPSYLLWLYFISLNTRVFCMNYAHTCDHTNTHTDTQAHKTHIHTPNTHRSGYLTRHKSSLSMLISKLYKFNFIYQCIYFAGQPLGLNPCLFVNAVEISLVYEIAWFLLKRESSQIRVFLYVNMPDCQHVCLTTSPTINN